MMSFPFVFSDMASKTTGPNPGGLYSLRVYSAKWKLFTLNQGL